MKNDIGGDGDTYDHSLQLHYRGSFLLHSFLLIYHPYPLSLHEMIFILVSFAIIVMHNNIMCCTSFALL